MAARTLTRQSNERQASLRKELDQKQAELDTITDERNHYASEVQSLNALIADSDNFRSQNDQHKERIERELVTVEGSIDRFRE